MRNTERDQKRPFGAYLAILIALTLSTACASGLRTSPDDYPGMTYRQGAEGHTVLYDVRPADATGRFVVGIYPNHSVKNQIDISAAGTSEASHHPLSPEEAVDYARELREWLGSKDRPQTRSGWQTYRNEETRIILSDLPFGDNLVAFRLHVTNTSNGENSEYIMHVHQRYIAGMAQALEIAANMLDGRY